MLVSSTRPAWLKDLAVSPELLAPWRPVTLRILVVADSLVTFNTGFGLGMMIDTMRDNVYGYVRFNITLARRDGSAGFNASPGPYDPTYTGFRFNRTEADGSPTIHKFHQIWCFGFAPGNSGSTNDGDITNSASNPTSDGELEVLTRWMDEREGGVFATGDHHFLGASMCHRIPRVATMRKWTNAQGVPPISGSSRHDTNRPATTGQMPPTYNTMPNSNEEDHVPQPLEWKPYSNGFHPVWFRYLAPHPILCDPVHGVIDIFPDHPHEGWIIEDADVVKTNTFNFNGYSGDEYPTVGGVQPLPEVIAWANTLPAPPYRFAKGNTPSKRFGVMGVYDGQRIGRGRVVVVATWHHWFTMNLEGLAADTTTNHYERIQTYFRNIAIWLARSAQRQRMLSVSTWYSMFTLWGVEEYGVKIPIYELGRIGYDVLGRFIGKCRVRQFIFDFLEPPLLREIAPIDWPEELQEGLPVKFDVIERAIIGGLASELVKERDAVIVEIQQKGRSSGRDEKQLVTAATAGVELAFKELGNLAEESVKRNSRLARSFAKSGFERGRFEKALLEDDDARNDDRPK